MSRVERRRASTRARIVEAAERLMRDRGVEAVTIQDITEAADVGHGTFYLHFKTKADVLQPVIAHLSEQVHAQVDRAARGAEDPALRMALGFRILLRAISEDPLWSWYAHSGRSFSELIAGMGTPPLDDVRRGLESGRYVVADLSTAWSFIDGALIGVITSLGAGMNVDTVAETTVELVLRALGIPADEAAQIAREPLELH
ncbi:MAG: TetR/AcrR family transcriptional regulator [Myxococcota bacterium]